MVKNLITFFFSKNALFFLGLALNIIGLIYYLVFAKEFFWDFEVYSKAINSFNNGMQVYLTDDKYKFIYPPFFLYSISILGASFQVTYLIFFMFSLILFFTEKLRNISFGIILSSFVFFNGAPPLLVGLATGNISIILNLWLIFLFFKSFESSFYETLFIVSVIIFSLIKFNFLIYSIALFIFTPNFKNFKFILIIIVMTLVFYLLEFIFMNDLFIEFIESLKHQTIYKDSYDMGHGFNNVLLQVLNNFMLANTLSLFLCFALAMFVASKHLIFKDILGKEMYKYFVLILILLLNPRLMIYDSLFIGGLTISLFLYLNKFEKFKEPWLFLSIFLISSSSWFISYSFDVLSIWNFPIACIFLPVSILLLKLSVLYTKIKFV